MARITAKISDDTDMIVLLPAPADLDHDSLELLPCDTSEISDPIGNRTPSIVRGTRAVVGETAHTSGNTDMMASVRADTSGNTDTTAANTTGDVVLQPPALPCQAHAH